MNPPIDETLDPGLVSWVEAANAPECDFPIQNLPFGRFRSAADREWRIGVAIGDQVLDLRRAGLISGTDMNQLMSLGREAQRALRLAISRGLRRGSAQQAEWPEREALVPLSAAELALPCRIGDYTDFYTSIHHATAVGRLFRPDNPLLPNYKWLPIGYHGRASSIVVSGTDFRRPVGQTRAPDQQIPTLGPTRRLDYELELGIVVGPGNALGEPVAIGEAEAHLFGLALFNDWSARDIQPWEYQPLGPFLSKNFASTLSPWIVTMDALAPFRAPYLRPEDDPAPLPYLDDAANRAHGAFDIELEVRLQSAAMKAAGLPAQTLARANYRDAYWTAAQLVAHHTVNGCNLQPGDLLGTGTLSGPRTEEAGSLLELTAGGKLPIRLNSGETRIFLEDGDTITLKAWCERPGARRIGFGECSATVLPARDDTLRPA